MYPVNNDNCKLELKCDGKPKVAFVCNHNSCRSQIAEALGKLLASDVFDSYSAGTIIKNQINQDAVRMMKEVHNIDMEATQFNKRLDEIPAPDVVIFMGCNVSCPNLRGQHVENWGLDDPSGMSDDVFKETINSIYNRVIELKEKLL
ncbi:MAG: arsenate reductase ArsC [Eubacteriales bacterium]